MIKNDRAYRVTKAAAEKFEQALADHEAKPIEEGSSDIARAAELSALRAQLGDLRAELAEYEALRTGGVEKLEAKRLEDLPSLLIRARIAEGLTHEQLGERIGVKPQQIQRWEDDDYQSASFWRLVEVAEALGLSVDVHAQLPEPSRPDVGIILEKLRKAGVDKTFVEQKLVPLPGDFDQEDSARVLAVRVEAIFGRPLPELVAANDDQPWGRRAVGNARYKVPAKAKEAPIAVFSAYAHFLASALCDAQSKAKSAQLPEDWAAMRSWLFRRGKPDLKVAVSRLWDAGIPVLPLSAKGGPHGACWRIRGRSAVVLKQPVRTTSRWLFDLVHELRHLVEAGDCDEFELLEGEGTSDGRRLSPEEERAHAFAADVLLEGRAGSLYESVVKDARNQAARIKGSLLRVASAEGVEVGLLANHVAFRFCLATGENIWGVAHKLQAEANVEPFAVVRDVLLEKLDPRSLPEPAGGLLRQALS
jgi:transcriptional regulator with XRE-family HTH domain